MHAGQGGTQAGPPKMPDFGLFEVLRGCLSLSPLRLFPLLN